jgi:pSer/pThr/pTyr-binding forkhead associated (FHA) protein
MKFKIDIKLGGKSIKTLHLTLDEGESKTIGREGTLLKLENSARVSRSHGSFYATAASLCYRDHSSNGTLKDGSKVAELELRHGDKLVVGDSVLAVSEIEASEGTATGVDDAPAAKKLVAKPVMTLLGSLAFGSERRHFPKGRNREFKNSQFLAPGRLQTGFQRIRGVL